MRSLSWAGVSTLAVLFAFSDAQAQTGFGTPASAADNPAPSEQVTVTGTARASPTRRPAGQTTYSADRDTFADTPAQSVAAMLATVPGVTVQAGNGPRDTVVSVRGSGARQSNGLKNIQVTEDGFPVTQPDGIARADLIDPHAYQGVDVFQGPASTLYGNYAINGAINFRTRDGAEIDGLELGSDFGSFGQFNQYMSLGAAGRAYDLSVFASDVRGDGFVPNASFNTSTENVRLRVTLGARDRLVFKFINNVTDTLLPLRLSLSQFRANPYQRGCADAAQAAPGCASITLFRNGRSGPTVAVSPLQAGLGRFDRRTIVGSRWEHDLDDRTTWRTQFTYDQRHVDQPTATTAFVGPFNSYNVQTDLTNRVDLGRRPLVSYVAASYDYLDLGYQVYNLTPQGGATRGALNATTYGHQSNAGLRWQEDWRFAPRWHAVVGLGGTYSEVGAFETVYGYTGSSVALRGVTANRFFFNLAPEAALVYAPSRDWTLHTRVGTAYATPSYSNFFVTPQGTYGNNTQLKSQTSVGIDLGLDWHPSPAITVQATGFYEFYRNELVSQSPGIDAPAGNYTFNAPASQHRGVELAARWKPVPAILPGASAILSYTYDNQIYTDYIETLSNSTIARSFSRDGKRIPGVTPHALDARLLYDQPDGPLEGFGGFVELSWQSSFFLDNANRVSAPGYALVNLELHYHPPARFGWVHRLQSWFEIQNLANRTYAAGATVISDSLLSGGEQAGAAALANKTGSIFAGSPRAFLGGVRVGF
ncbi:TonB-dependent receptor [Acetobacteraceae bacterium KSS8]|uniref:TonB-dependent receptor n=1 Tax=Endosaccharibacter trunci TaxID=2812733 RepID=A0ABT1W7M6_9PROT|nr:TonB-dependent receptor [Acetobacteraceae bacterium KSS8]